MKKVVSIFLISFFFVIFLFAGVYAEAYVERVYGTCEMQGRYSAPSSTDRDTSKKAWFDYGADIFTGTKLYFNSKDRGYDLGVWKNSQIVPSGGYFVDSFGEQEDVIKKDCSEGCEKQGWDGIYTGKDGFLEYGCMEQNCNYYIDEWKKLPVTTACDCNSIISSKEGKFYEKDGLSCYGKLNYTEVYNEIPLVCEKSYNLGEYHLEINNEKAPFGQGKIFFDIMQKLIISPDPKKNGKIELYGKFTMQGVGSLSLDKFNSMEPNSKTFKENNFYGRFIMKNVKGEEIDIMKELLEPILQDTGITSGSIEIISKPSEVNNELWHISVRGKLNQWYRGKKSEERGYDREYGPFKQEQIKEFHHMFKKALDNIVTEGVNTWVLSESATEVKKEGIKKVIEDGKEKQHRIWITETKDKGQSKEILYAENLKYDGTYKKIRYVFPEKNIDSLLECLKKLQKQTKSQSVWLENLSEGVAYYFYPPYNFSANVILIFNKSGMLHFGDSVLDGSEYYVIETNNRTINKTGGILKIKNIAQIFPEGAVLNKTEFSISLINITRFNQCRNRIQDSDETGVDCGGNCEPCPESCYDGIKNQNEENIDCGGACKIGTDNKSLNESCGFDYDRDCSYAQCPLKACTSHEDCGQFGGCIDNSSCLNDLSKEELKLLIQKWKEQEIDLRRIMNSIKIWIQGIDVGGI